MARKAGYSKTVLLTLDKIEDEQVRKLLQKKADISRGSWYAETEIFALIK
jgi:hypothetical protein